MLQFTKALWSSVGKKYLMALTGLFFIFFLIEHVSGNLMLYSKNPDPYNQYTHFLTSFGSILYVIEVIMIAIFLVHIVSAVSIALGKRKARPVAYEKSGNAGGTSKKTFSSMTMIWTGLLTLVFVVIHIKTFKYGPHYIATVDGVEMRDMHRLVIEVFQNPIYVAWYVGALLFLGFHLRHGFWSAFQSLGVNHPRYSPLIYSVGIFLAVAIAAGFIGIPIWIFITGA